MHTQAQLRSERLADIGSAGFEVIKLERRDDRRGARRRGELVDELTQLRRAGGEDLWPRRMGKGLLDGGSKGGEGGGAAGGGVSCAGAAGLESAKYA